MMQGDSFYLTIELTDDSGETVVPAMLADLEIVVGNVRKTLKDGNIAWDSERKLFSVELAQRDTFALGGEEQVIARPKFNGGVVIGVNLGTISFDKTISKVVL